MALDLGTLWAVLVSVVATMVVGMLGYGPVFGKPWMRAMGMDALSDEERAKMQKEGMPGYMASMGMTAVAVILLDFLVDWTEVGGAYADRPGWVGGMAVAFTAWAAFYVPGTLTAQFFEGRRWLVWALGAGYWGVLALLWGAFVGAFS